MAPSVADRNSPIRDADHEHSLSANDHCFPEAVLFEALHESEGVAHGVQRLHAVFGTERRAC